MQALAVEEVFLNSQYQKDEDGNLITDENNERILMPGEQGFKVKPLNSLQFCEVMTDGFEVRGGNHVMKFAGTQLLLRYGLENPSIVNKLSALKMTELAHAIYAKSALAEAEGKN
tara:strand:- start:112 stop:456 length:345 start_codon:yes stop_codon:yes gene_type:complete